MKIVTAVLLVVSGPAYAATWDGGGFGVNSDSWNGGLSSWTVPSPYSVQPHVFHDGLTLYHFAHEGLSPDFYDGTKGFTPAAGLAATPAAMPAPAPTMALFTWADDDEARDGLSLVPVRPDGPRPGAPAIRPGPEAPITPVPIPLPAAGWLLLAGIGGMLWMKRRPA